MLFLVLFFLCSQTIKCLLIDPNPESALNEEAGKLLLEDYAEFSRRAEMMTRIHAKAGKDAPEKSAPPSSVSSSSAVSSGSSSIKAGEKKKVDRKRNLKRL